MEFCPPSVVMTLLGGINTIDPDSYGYVDEGVTINRSALGAFASIYTSRISNLGSSVDLTLYSALNEYGLGLLSTSQCVPVLKFSPISCSKAGNVSYNDGYIAMSTENGRCYQSKYAGPSVTWGHVVTAAGVCSTGSLGQAITVIGGLMAAAIYLAEAIGDADWLRNFDSVLSHSTDPQTYRIICTVDTKPAIQYRNLTLTLQSTDAASNTYARRLIALNNQDCVLNPLSGIADSNLNKLIALSAFGTWQPLDLGWTLPLRHLTMRLHNGSEFVSHTQYIRQPPFAFENSKNALEDLLGLISALPLSRVSTNSISRQVAYIGNATLQYTRAGTGEIWALVYVIPSFLVLLTIIALLITSRRNATLSSAQLVDLVNIQNRGVYQGNQ